MLDVRCWMLDVRRNLPSAFSSRWLWALPAGEFEDAGEADGVKGVGATPLAAETGELDEHFGGAGGVAGMDAGAPRGKSSGAFLRNAPLEGAC